MGVEEVEVEDGVLFLYRKVVVDWQNKWVFSGSYHHMRVVVGNAVAYNNVTTVSVAK